MKLDTDDEKRIGLQGTQAGFFIGEGIGGLRLFNMNLGCKVMPCRLMTVWTHERGNVDSMNQLARFWLS